MTDPIPMLIHCPMCSGRHIDEGEFATKPHHTHACQHCGHTWRPAIVATVGVQFLPGFKNEEPVPTESELKAMMQDQRYWKQRDPAFIEKVSQGFRRLHGEA